MVSHLDPPLPCSAQEESLRDKVQMREARLSAGMQKWCFVSSTTSSSRRHSRLLNTWEIDGDVVASDALLGFMKNKDKDYFEALGFGVAPRLGLAYDLDHDGSWTT